MISSDEPSIAAVGVTKRYGKTVALRDVSFSASASTVTALLGPNGAGKTTMVRILSTLTRPDNGTARVCGYDVVKDPERVRGVIGLTGQALSVDGKLSGQQNLAMFGRLHRLAWPVVRERSARLLELFDLGSAANRPVKTYSGGMRRKLDLALSLIAEPTILFLDEPTTGLDPASRQALWDVIRGLVRRGTTVLLTTQYLEEADALADSVVFINAGQLVAAGPPAQLKARAGQAQFDLVASSPADLIRLTGALGAHAAATDDANRSVRVTVRGGGLDGIRELNAITAAAAQAGVSIERFTLHEPDLSDVYFQLTGHAPAAGVPVDAA
ncbi:MAG TPA: ATP-binding cassette domain-containing protein [Streptosporangiaceae bacterium]|nr:ATP-binding cassette domain-containing protein [Streptosporangiaceae bacterium]